MLYIVETAKDAETAARDLEEAAKRNKFGVISLLDLRQKMKEKGVEFPHACKILEVCNPEQASRLLSHNISISTALPCRISVYEEDGRIKIATMLPSAILSVFLSSGVLKPIAEEVESQIIKIIDEAK
jgi:uncharacterized protein (DUF302 family)